MSGLGQMYIKAEVNTLEEELKRMRGTRVPSKMKREMRRKYAKKHKRA